MHLTFGTDTDGDLLETLFRRLRGYTVSVGPGDDAKPNSFSRSRATSAIRSCASTSAP